MNPTSSHRVVVLGAGMSGLACACELRQRGYQVLVVEARSRPGGRLKSSRLHLQGHGSKPNGVASPTKRVSRKKNVSVASSGRNGGKANKKDKKTQEEIQESVSPGVFVDMGGALIHGIEENPLATLVHDSLGLSTRKVQETLLMNDSGWPVDAKEDERVAQIFDETLEEAFRRAELTFSDDDGKRKPPKPGAPNPEESFGSVLQQVWNIRSVTEDVILRWYKSNLEVSCGVGLEKLGLEWNEDEAYGFEGDHVALTGSWQPVVDALSRGLDILYKTEVIKIQVLHPQDSNLSREVSPPKQAAAAASRRTASPARKKPRMANQSENETSRKSYESTWNQTEIVSLRQSRRLRGVDGSDASLRRSVRSTKGKFDNRYVVPEPMKSGATKSNNDEAFVKDVKKTSKVSSVETPKEEARRSSIALVTLKNGKVLEADSVVCTLPLAMLQQQQVTFEPPLPIEKQIAIDSLGCGLLNKVRKFGAYPSKSTKHPSFSLSCFTVCSFFSTSFLAEF